MNIVEQAENAAEFINDRTHEQHLDQLLWMLRTRRDEAASRVPEWEQLRDLASQIKEHTLSNLAHYLEMFESRAKANGVTVHWAQDAHEHNQIVYQLLSDRNVNELNKSKSMLLWLSSLGQASAKESRCGMAAAAKILENFGKGLASEPLA
jgi:L-lactate dehydrogenase complex protein LldF